MYYLQLRHDILEERSHCSEEQALRLGGLAMQAEYSDWYEHARHVTPEHYLAPRILRRIGHSFSKDALVEQHQLHYGMSEAQAELQFIKVCETLLSKKWGDSV